MPCNAAASLRRQPSRTRARARSRRTWAPSVHLTESARSSVPVCSVRVMANAALILCLQAGTANPAAACKDPEDRYMRVFRSLWIDEELHRLRIHPTVIDLFTRIFGEPALAHPMFVQRNIFSQTDGFDFTTG